MARTKIAPCCHLGALSCVFVFSLFGYDGQATDLNFDVSNVVIISDRAAAVRVAVSSIFVNTRSSVTVWIISATPANVEEACHNLSRLDNQVIKVLDFDMINHDLVANGAEPLWTWREYGSSIQQGSKWLTTHSVRVGLWDYSTMHSHRMNMLRFYLPEIAVLRSIETCFFMDDDVILRQDISMLSKRKPYPGVVLVGTCATWVFDRSSCAFAPKIGSSLREGSGLYLNVNRCGRMRKHNCRPDSYEQSLQWLRQRFGSKLDFDRSPIWNFGFAAIDFKEWRKLKMTQGFEAMMRGVYQKHLFPETSLAYGLGVAFLLLGGYVQCWETLNVTIFDGAGYITEWDEAMSGLPVLTQDTFAIHWSGNDKPWVAESFDPAAWIRPWRRHWEEASQQAGVQVQQTNSRPNVRVVVLTDPSLDSDWFMQRLDQHPEICASGERNSDRFGFHRETMSPPKLSEFQGSSCVAKQICTWEAIQKYVPYYVQNFKDRCVFQKRLVKPVRSILCKWAARVRKLRKSKGMDLIKQMFVDVIFGDDAFRNRNDLPAIGLPCNCPPKKQYRAFTVMEDWIYYTKQGNNLFDSSAPKFPWESIKVISLIKQNPLRALIKRERRNVVEPVTIDTRKLVADLRDWDRHGYNFLGDKRTVTMLEVDYEKCVRDSVSCLRRAVQFLGADVNLLTNEINTQVVAGNLKRSRVAGPLMGVANAEEVRSALKSENLSFFISAEMVGN